MRILTICFLLFVQQSVAQSFSERELQSEISEVTVFLKGAQIKRTAEINLPKGKFLLRIKSLSPHMDDKSVQVKGEGDFTILSVGHHFNHLKQLERDNTLDSLSIIVDSLVVQKSMLNARIEVIAEKEKLLNNNKKFYGDADGVSVADLQEAYDFYDRTYSELKTEQLEIKSTLEDLTIYQNKLKKEIADASQQEHLPTGEIEIRVEAEQATKATFSVSYFVKNAGWYPKYDVRVKNVEQPIELTYKAEVYQNTGNDWEDVKLKFSNANPDQSGMAPQLFPWHINYARNTIYNKPEHRIPINSVKTISGKIWDHESQEPLIGVNIQVKGTSIGTVTDIDGNYELTLPNGAQYLILSYTGFDTKEIPITASKINSSLESSKEYLDEVVVTGYGLSGSVRGLSSNRNYRTKPKTELITTTIENTTTVEFEVEIPYSIKSDGETMAIDLKRFDVNTLYEYYAVPKLDKTAFLIARITDWDQYNLLEGEANLYFEEAYVGRSILDAKVLADTLSLSLGRDKNIVIGRTKLTDFSKRQTIGRNKIESREFEIIVRNKKSQAINITLSDQIPVAALNDITVEPTKLSNAQLNEKTGEVTWEISIPAQQQIKRILAYEVKYPKRERVYLE